MEDLKIGGLDDLSSDSDDDNDDDDRGDGSDGAINNDDDVDSLSSTMVSNEMSQAFKNLDISGDPLRDSEWIEKRNEKLIGQMLDLEKPIITEQMLDFLGQDSVMENMLQYLCREEKGWKAEDGQVKRLGIEDKGSKDMERSYKVAMLLSGDGTRAEPRHTFVSANSDTVLRAVMKCFTSGSGANLHHAIHLLMALTATMPDKVIDLIGRNSSAVKRNFGCMLHFIGWSCVERFLMETCSMQSLDCTSDRRWKFSCSLSDWRMLMEIGQLIYDGDISEEDASAASRVLLELVRNFSTSDSGEILLSPLGYCPDLSSGLIEGACNMNWSLPRRCDCARVLLDIVERCREAEIVVQAPQSQVRERKENEKEQGCLPSMRETKKKKQHRQPRTASHLHATPLPFALASS